MSTPTRAELAHFDRKCPKAGSNDEWTHPQDPDATITRMKDGRTRLAHKAEHAVDLETGTVVGVTVQECRCRRHRTDARQTAEFLGVEMDEVAGMGMFVASHRGYGLKGGEAMQPVAAQDATDAGGRYTHASGNLRPAPASSEQRDDGLEHRRWQRAETVTRPGAAVRQADGPLGLIAGDPLAHGTRTDARGCRDPAYRLFFSSTRATTCGEHVASRPVLSTTRPCATANERARSQRHETTLSGHREISDRGERNLTSRTART